MIEQEVEIDTGVHTLAGTVCRPKDGGPFPFVLMIHGSGPLDRDENMKMQKLNVFNVMAHHLAGVGIASLRYDKRGNGKSGGDYYSATGTDLVEDALYCLDAMGKRPDCHQQQMYVLGHSEGTVIAPKLSIQRPGVAGIVLVCPFVQPIEAVLQSQAQHVAEDIERLPGVKGILTRFVTGLFGGPTKGQQKFLAKLKRTSAPVIRHNLSKVPAAWFREALELNPKTLFCEVQCPTFLLAGEKDIQCDPADAAVIADLVQGPAEVAVIDNLTHLLRFDPDEPSIFNYKKQMKMPVETVVLERIAAWLVRQSSA